MQIAQKTISSIRTLTATAFISLLITGCGYNTTETESFIAAVKKKPTGAIPPIPEIATYNAFEYPGHDRDPFDPDIMAAAISPTMAQPKSNINIDTNRAKEYLESFPLDGLKMVGTLTRNNKLTALIQTPDGTIQRVSGGNYVGQNYGKIKGITENEISLTEIVPDGFGGYMERQAAIALSGEQ